jgi:4-hydroxy-2-oxoheptanedioate aldolase
VRENGVKRKIREGGVALGAWLTIPSALPGEILARQGYDYVCIDLQHGLIGYQEAVSMLQALGAAPAAPFVRVPMHDFSMAHRLLDAGALGVIFPLVESVEEARDAANACRYPPAGTRSFGPVRGGFYGSDYFARANDEIACVPMIETRQALERLDAILAVPGVDAVYVGPNDLSLALGQPPSLDGGGAFEEARLRIARACVSRGVGAGIHANADLAKKHADAGYRMITITVDGVALASSARRDLARARGEG